MEVGYARHSRQGHKSFWILELIFHACPLPAWSVSHDNGDCVPVGWGHGLQNQQSCPGKQKTACSSPAPSADTVPPALLWAVPAQSVWQSRSSIVFLRLRQHDFGVDDFYFMGIVFQLLVALGKQPFAALVSCGDYR